MLVIDDEPLLLGVMTRILGGYAVEVRSDARQALELITAGRVFDVLLVDVSMPDMSGVAFYQALHAIQPALAARIVFMSGGVFDAGLDAFLNRVPNRRIGKPFRGPALRAVVQQVLDEPAGEPGR